LICNTAYTGNIVTLTGNTAYTLKNLALSNICTHYGPSSRIKELGTL
jgi:hypothetical protein